MKKHLSFKQVLETESANKLFQMANVTFENAKKNDTRQRAKAMQLWQAAMDKGHSSAKYSYAECVRRGEGDTKPDPKRAVRIFEELVKDKHPWGTYALADMVYNGEGTSKNESRAFELYRNSAEMKIPAAYYNVGNMFASGNGVRQDLAQAVSWYEKGAGVGDPKAKSSLGDILCATSGPVPQDMKRGFELRRAAATAGIPMALFNVGWHYLKGCGVEQDYFLAAKYFKKASDKGVAIATVNLAILCRDGLGVKRDPTQAKRLLQTVAPHDDYAAQLLQVMK